ncbi:MAG: DUF58 domain-containing protein [Bacillota bacterium]|nr:DUF58 domain-containing protein [Bacillota bacterium]
MDARKQRTIYFPIVIPCCIAALMVTALPAVFMNGVSGYVPALFLTMLLLLSFVSLLLLRRAITVEADHADVYCVRGESVEIGLRLHNRSRFFCPKAAAFVTISDLFGGNDALRQVRFTVSGRGEVKFRFELEMPHLGCYRVGVERIELYDAFGVFRLSLPAFGCCTATVTPRIRPILELTAVDNATVEAASETRLSVVGGTDYTGVRPYALGDPMKQIHWKLSAHSHEYVTKIQESNRQQEYVVILDFAAAADLNPQQLMELNDCLIETALSLVEEIYLRGESYTLLYMDRGGQLCRAVPAGTDSYAELMSSFAMIAPQSAIDGAQLLQQEAAMQNRAGTVLAVTCKASAELTQQLVSIKNQRRTAELYFVIPADWSRRQRETAALPLLPLSDADVSYYFVSTAENRVGLNDVGNGHGRLS